jgi:hypothetical protein
MQQTIKENKVSKSGYEYETFDTGSKALVLDEKKEKDVFAAIDQLGLAGQKTLIERGNGNLIPFPKMTAAERRVWEEYCPEKKKLQEYSATLIPYEILTLATLVEQRGYFKDQPAEGKEKPKLGWIEVWSESREDIDPLLVGCIGESDWSHDSYLLGRWGIALRPFEEIRKMAVESWKAKRKAKAEAVIATLDNDANEHFSGGWVI